MKAVLRSIRKLIFKSFDKPKNVNPKNASPRQLKAMSTIFFKTFVFDSEACKDELAFDEKVEE